MVNFTWHVHRSMQSHVRTGAGLTCACAHHSGVPGAVALAADCDRPTPIVAHACAGLAPIQARAAGRPGAIGWVTGQARAGGWWGCRRWFAHMPQTAEKARKCQQQTLSSHARQVSWAMLGLLEVHPVCLIAASLIGRKFMKASPSKTHWTEHRTPAHRVCF
jgi:hypothetical protein